MPEQEPKAVRRETEVLEPLDPPIDADEDLLEEFEEDTDEIDLTHMRIKSLKKLGLERFPNVTYACFRQNQLINLKGLDNLPSKLENLDLYDNNIERMDHHLEHFNGTALKSLDLSFNNIRHIRHVQGITGLEQLFLCQNEVSRIEGLDDLAHLTNLELGANRIKEIQNLEKLQSLEMLWLAKNRIPKLENLGSLSNLRLLSIQNNKITKIEGLDKLTNLEELYISFNQIEKVEGLENLSKLNTLDIGNNKIKELTGLSHLTNLEELWAGYNELERYDSVEKELKHLPKFHTIYLEGNPLQKASGPMYRKKVQLALGPNLVQIDATPLR